MSTAPRAGRRAGGASSQAAAPQPILPPAPTAAASVPPPLQELVFEEVQPVPATPAASAALPTSAQGPTAEDGLSWLDDGEAPNRPPAEAFRPAAVPSEASSATAAAAADPDGDELFAAMGITPLTPTVSSATPLSPGTKQKGLPAAGAASGHGGGPAVGGGRAAVPPPMSLAEQHAQLLAELHATERDVIDQRLRNSAAESTARRAANAQRIEEAVKQADLSRQQALAHSQTDEAHALSARRVQNASDKGAQEVAELDITVGAALQKRHERIVAGLNEDIAAATADVAKLESQYHLLLQATGTSDPRAVAARIGSKRDLDAKIKEAVQVLVESHRAIDDNVERRVGHMINLESSALAAASHNARQKTFLEHSSARRGAFAEFQKGLVEGATTFHAKRHEQRREDLHAVQGLLRQGIADSRDRVVGAAGVARDQCKLQFEELTSKFRAEYADHVRLAAQREQTIVAEDGRIAAAQVSEQHGRGAVDRRLKERLFAEEKDTTAALLAKNSQRERSLRKAPPTTVGAVTHAGTVAEIHLSIADMISGIKGSTEKQLKRNAHARGVGGNYNRGAADGEEERLMSLFRDKTQTLDAIRTATRDQLADLDGARERLTAALAGITERTASLATLLHDARLEQQAQLSRADVARLQWEREHRALLSSEHLLPAESGPAQAPALDIALGLSQRVAAAAAQQIERYDAFAKRRAALLQQVRIGDAHVAEGTDVQRRWEGLFGALLRVLEELQRLSDRQVSVLAEEAKLGTERELLLRERHAVSQRSRAISQQVAEANEDYQRLGKAHQQHATAARRLDADHDRIHGEMTTLVKMQSDLRHQQADQLSQARRLSEMRQRLMGPWGADRGLDGSAWVGNSSSSTVLPHSTDSEQPHDRPLHDRTNRPPLAAKSGGGGAMQPPTDEGSEPEDEHTSAFHDGDDRSDFVALQSLPRQSSVSPSFYANTTSMSDP